ncbi:indoleacetate--lysine synthetase [Colletotrichum asianum]|uniref:Indoleacetate--lysine synthetase n=1 Tax=Colletotrichum asianum TaxID=702518 RepID=A0A8H3WAL0_9PEZI|nr:indoleacetate--lysine synthetase [Colletotrichum asianum]
MAQPSVEDSDHTRKTGRVWRPDDPVTQGTFPLEEVLSVAKIHPFYSNAQYPPGRDTIKILKEYESVKADLKAQPVLRKKTLYNVIERLVNDTSPENTYRHNVYTSVTGGGSTTSTPLFFATDALENRRQRACFGHFLKASGVIEPGDWVLTTHCTGSLSLDLTCETMENAGASVLAAGNYMSADKVIQTLQDFSVNVLSGDGSQVLAIVHHISKMTAGREKIKIDKIIYTSEGLTSVQKAHIHAVLGSVKICSVLGSAEAGPYGVNSPALAPTDLNSNYTEFLIDTRMTIIEILPLFFSEGEHVSDTLPDGETGVVAQTSLTRLRNPLVRYITGDIGSLHQLPDRTRSLVPTADQPYLRLFRLQGRDQRISFLWDGYDIEFEKLSAVLAEPGLGVLQWQVILEKMEPSTEVLLEIRVLGCQSDGQNNAITNRLKEFFFVYTGNERRFRICFVDGMSGFELSETGRKVVKFVDRSS